MVEYLSSFWGRGTPDPMERRGGRTPGMIWRSILKRLGGREENICTNGGGDTCEGSGASKGSGRKICSTCGAGVSFHKGVFPTQ